MRHGNELRGKSQAYVDMVKMQDTGPQLCNKVRHRNKRVARSVAGRMHKAYQLYTYKCSRCGWWHVSKRERP